MAHFEETLSALDRTVGDAVVFFAQVDETLADGHQTAREVLSHLVFWHREYVAVARALTADRKPELKSGTFASLNALASQEFRDRSLPDLAERLAGLQRELDAALASLPDLGANFPVKRGGRYWSVEDRVPTIESHIRNHVRHLKRAAARRERMA